MLTPKKFSQAVSSADKDIFEHFEGFSWTDLAHAVTFLAKRADHFKWAANQLREKYEKPQNSHQQEDSTRADTFTSDYGG